ncbi:MAG TPA: hypothetical protein VIX80_10970 [Candidatus Kapabacteria bacterium]
MDTIVSGQPRKRVELPPELRYVKKKKNLAITIFQWAVILISGAGFTFKFIEYTISVFNSPSDIVNFAITPLVMYMSVAAGFLCLFIWTVIRGDYKDTELPKFRFFERELEIDEDEREENERAAKKILFTYSKN